MSTLRPVVDGNGPGAVEAVRVASWGSGDLGMEIQYTVSQLNCGGRNEQNSLDGWHPDE